MKKLLLFSFILLNGVLFTACEETPTETVITKPIDTSSVEKIDTLETKEPPRQKKKNLPYHFSEEDFSVITVTDNLILGASYTNAKAYFPNFKGVRAENKSSDLANKGYTEGVSEVTLFGQKGLCTFHFKDSTLKSYEVTLRIVDPKKNSAKYSEISKYLNYQYGESDTPVIEEENYTKQIEFWKTNNGYIYLSNELSSGMITFGRQTQQPE
jgi:hypothetical protein